jgi:hypothetical protein
MRLLCFPILLLLTTVPTNASTLSGTVRDSEGAVIAKAQIIIHWDPSGANYYLKDNLGIKQDITILSDVMGKFSVELPPGFYDIVVMATSFSPQCDVVRLKDKEAKDYKVKLKVSGIISKEID